MSKTRTILPAGMMLLAITAVAWSQNQCADKVTSYGPTRIVTELTGDQVVGSVATRALAKAYFDVRPDGTVHYKVDTTGLDCITGVYIHQGRAQQVGPVIATLFVPSSPTSFARGTVVEGTLTTDNLTGDYAGRSVSDLVDQMMNNNVYVNITTVNNPEGMLRGNIPYPYD